MENKQRSGSCGSAPFCCALPGHARTTRSEKNGGLSSQPRRPQSWAEPCCNVVFLNHQRGFWRILPHRGRNTTAIRAKAERTWGYMKVGSCAQVAKPELDGFMACVNDHLKWSIWNYQLLNLFWIIHSAKPQNSGSWVMSQEVLGCFRSLVAPWCFAIWLFDLPKPHIYHIHLQ